MEAILTTFGIDWRLLLIQAVNFGLLVAGLWYFLYEPLSQLLRRRQELVEQGVRDAQSAAQQLQAVDAARRERLADAGREADEIVAAARAAAAHAQRELAEAGEAAAASLLRDAQAQAQELKAAALEESKQAVAKLIVLGVERALTK